MLILPHTPGSQEQGRGHRGEKGPMGLRRPAVPQGLARVGRKRAARDRGSGSWAAWPGETSAWPSVPRTGATTLSFQVRLADLPVRPRLRGPHWETPLCWPAPARRSRMGGVRPVWQSGQSTRSCSSEETLRGWDGAGLGPPPEQSASLPETTIASRNPGSHGRPHTPRALGTRGYGGAGDGVGLLLTHVLEPLTCSCSCCSLHSCNSRMIPCRTTCIRAGLPVQGQAPTKSKRYPRAGGALPLLLTPLLPELCADSLQTGTHSCACLGGAGRTGELQCVLGVN